MTLWLRYEETREDHTVTGDLRVCKAFHSPELGNTRDILVWLPPSYGAGTKRYPVIYMHDGQNLFDARTSYVGEWGVDETLTALSAEGLETIVVGIPHMNDLRIVELNPYQSPRPGVPDGRGDDYLRFIINTLKPLIDADFRTLPEKETTGIAGSSMGGLISLYGFLMHQEVFGLCGAFSTAYWFGRGRLYEAIEAKAHGGGKIYLDVGTKEGHVFAPSPLNLITGGKNGNRRYFQGVQRLAKVLRTYGYRDGENLLYVEDEGGLHNESAWARRLPDAFRFLIPRLG
ncbi:MAG TPA: alpha/beta hydrolase-fold protein [Aggregatilineales bacterium]|nr:alpha/beta hydrolase [Anaerolineales bacterium]HRE48348.1 alpha/beta hydrolase-fold protein [Aggregatilineales bacterium]